MVLSLPLPNIQNVSKSAFDCSTCKLSKRNNPASKSALILTGAATACPIMKRGCRKLNPRTFLKSLQQSPPIPPECRWPAIWLVAESTLSESARNRFRKGLDSLNKTTRTVTKAKPENVISTLFPRRIPRGREVEFPLSTHPV